MAPTRIRPVVPIVGVAVIVVASGLRLGGYVSSRATERDESRMIAIAAHLDDPAGLTTRRRVTCPDVTTVVRCLEGDQDPDTLAAAYRAALSTAAGRPAALQCETTRVADRRPRNCLVRVDDGDHAVLISVSSRAVRTATGITLSGSDVRVDAD